MYRPRIKIGTRPSPLAMAQAREAIEFLRGMGFDEDIRVIGIESMGDIDKISPLSRSDGSDFFTGAIESSLIRGDIDIAVHSAKDLEDSPPRALEIAALTPSLSIYEALVSGSGLGISALPPGSIIGTSSVKRKSSILSFRPDLVCRDIRGNIGERLEKMDRGEYDAIIVAHAALLRLGLESRMTELLPVEIFPPHPLQGMLAIQVRRNDKALSAKIRGLDEETG